MEEKEDKTEARGGVRGGRGWGESVMVHEDLTIKKGDWEGLLSL